MNDYQGYFADCYVLTNKRTESFIEKFLNHFLPERNDSGQFEVSQYSDNPLEKLNSIRDKIKFLVENRTIKHSLYWENSLKSDLRGVELFFTDDSHIIMGIYCETKYPNTEIVDVIFNKMKTFCESNIGYITYEDTPPHNSEEFILKIKKDNKGKNS